MEIPALPFGGIHLLDRTGTSMVSQAGQSLLFLLATMRFTPTLKRSRVHLLKPRKHPTMVDLPAVPLGLAPWASPVRQLRHIPPLVLIEV